MVCISMGIGTDPLWELGGERVSNNSKKLRPPIPKRENCLQACEAYKEQSLRVVIRIGVCYFLLCHLT